MKTYKLFFHILIQYLVIFPSNTGKDVGIINSKGCYLYHIFIRIQWSKFMRTVHATLSFSMKCRETWKNLNTFYRSIIQTRITYFIEFLMILVCLSNENKSVPRANRMTLHILSIYWISYEYKKISIHFKRRQM